ncbi:hypothetical protein AQS8620_00372 [Aquimixticola soesokkakensis]|uniref:Cysteine-rich CPCC domain-containing protein n=1 Tax=Aquimixticola soesokkakensis TaxID=1519096 RepID=A0A1Y5RHD5_9RHOB|nr:CPCC family cysteine-rich protein [Aquimixticola soesokkakensis]SLN17492.1 hypothetical protein AQS8620_00372 [Aquimixticola soesokkakensis]
MSDKKPNISDMFVTLIAKMEARDLSGAKDIDGWFLCPCCQQPTLTEREEYETCPLCLWIDDGQDDGDADDLLPMSENEQTLTQARANFADHGDRFTADASRDAVVQTPARKAALRYLEEVRAGKPFDIEAFHTRLAKLEEHP